MCPSPFCTVCTCIIWSYVDMCVYTLSFLHEQMWYFSSPICIVYVCVQYLYYIIPLPLFSIVPVHRCVQWINMIFLSHFFQTLLDLGVSPNLKDSRSLTPLYYTVSHCTSPSCMEMLLQERAFIGSQDEQGWFEIHHVRRLLL